MQSYAPATNNPTGMVNPATGLLTGIADRALDFFSLREERRAANARAALVPNAVETEAAGRATAAATTARNQTILIAGGVGIVALVLVLAIATRRRK